MDTQPPVIDEAKLNDFGVRLFALWGTHVTDRKPAEERWLQNMRQFRGIYDPEILSMIPKDMSRAYPKLTRWKLIGTVARLMQMLFPQTEKNYSVKTSPLPDLTKEQMQEVLDTLVTTTAQAKQVDPSQVTLTDEDIEKAIRLYAAGKAAKMELKIDDDLQEMEYITLARRVVFSAVLYCIGILKGPMHKRVRARSWQKNQFTGKYEAIEKDAYKPLFEFLSVWNWYPDMTATSLDKQDGSYERHIMTRAQVEELAERPDFFADRINKFLQDNTTGNYKAQWWESVIKGEPKGTASTTMSKEARKYEVYSYWGGVTGHELRGAGIEVKEADVGKTFHANAWLLDNIIIKAKLAPFDEAVKHHHVFIFEEDDLSILGNGQCDTLRDSQISLCEVTRATLDNMSVIGPMVEVNDDLLTPGQTAEIRKHKTWHREGTGNEASMPAVRNINIESHIPELNALRQVFLDFADKESGLPPPSLGDVSGGGSEALRTRQNASMFLGAAALPIRDTVRNFDTFTISVISALVAWNQKYDPNPARDGDHDVIARGSTSLIAKEVLSGALNEFRASITPDEAPHLKSRAMLISRMKVNDLPVEEFLEDEDVAEATIQRNAQAQQQQMEGQQKYIQAQVEELLTRAAEHAAKAEAEGGKLGVSVFQTLINAITAGHDASQGQAKALIDAAKVTKMGVANAGK